MQAAGGKAVINPAQKLSQDEKLPVPPEMPDDKKPSKDATQQESLKELTGHAKDDSGSDQAKPAGQCKKPPPGGGTCIPRVAAMLAHFLETLGELLSAVVKDNDMKAGQTDIMDSDVIKNDAD